MNGKQSNKFLQLLEVYIDNFIQIVQSSDVEVLYHYSWALIHSIHSVFPTPEITGHNV